MSTNQKVWVLTILVVFLSVLLFLSMIAGFVQADRGGSSSSEVSSQEEPVDLGFNFVTTFMGTTDDEKCKIDRVYDGTATGFRGKLFYIVRCDGQAVAIYASY